MQPGRLHLHVDILWVQLDRQFVLADGIVWLVLRDQRARQISYGRNRFRIELQDAPEERFGFGIALLPAPHNAQHCERIFIVGLRSQDSPQRLFCSVQIPAIYHRLGFGKRSGEMGRRASLLTPRTRG
jgi:hypothetical protein